VFHIAYCFDRDFIEWILEIRITWSNTGGIHSWRTMRSIFLSKYVRDISGRFCVLLLFHQHVLNEIFRGFRAVATKRFQYSEKKLVTDNRLRTLYCDFMSEYLTLGHMSPVRSKKSYFIFQHAVYRSSNTNLNIRVIFDSSMCSLGWPLKKCLNFVGGTPSFFC